MNLSAATDIFPYSCNIVCEVSYYNQSSLIHNYKQITFYWLYKIYLQVHQTQYGFILKPVFLLIARSNIKAKCTEINDKAKVNDKWVANSDDLMNSLVQLYNLLTWCYCILNLAFKQIMRSKQSTKDDFLV